MFFVVFFRDASPYNPSILFGKFLFLSYFAFLSPFFSISPFPNIPFPKYPTSLKSFLYLLIFENKIPFIPFFLNSFFPNFPFSQSSFIPINLFPNSIFQISLSAFVPVFIYLAKSICSFCIYGLHRGAYTEFQWPRKLFRHFIRSGLLPDPDPGSNRVRHHKWHE